MWEERLKHTNILKSVKEIKESIEELDLWVLIKYCTCWHNNIYKFWYYINNRQLMSDYWSILKYKNIWQDYLHNPEPDIKIIWQIHGWHLRMFLHKKLYVANFTTVDYIIIKQEWTRGNIKVEIEYNNTKSYNEQSEKFFKKINQFLITEFNINL